MRTTKRLVAARDVFLHHGDTAAAAFMQVLIVELVPSADGEWARLALMVAETALAKPSNHFVGLAKRLIVKAMSAGSSDARLEQILGQLGAVTPLEELVLGPYGSQVDQSWDGTPRGLLHSIGALPDDPLLAFSHLPAGGDRLVVVDAMAGHAEPRRFFAFLDHCKNHPDPAVRRAAVAS